MQEADDIKLLREYANGGSDDAFGALVSRYVNLVYSAALRHTGNPDHAQEITQAVFIILARKAGRLSRNVVLSGWLYQTARLAAANFMRTEIRRARREQEAQMQSIANEPDPGAWTGIAPMLDAAMGDLGEKDRNAIVLRFFQRKSLNEVGIALGSNEDAARMRINRALEQLRTFFAKRGVTLSVAAISTAVATNSVQAAPPGMAAAVGATTVKGIAATASLGTLVKGTTNTMNWLSLKLPLGIGATVILAGGLILAFSRSNASPGSPAAATGQFPGPELRLPGRPAARPPDAPIEIPAVAAADDLSSTNLLERIRQAYAALTSYRGQGSRMRRWGDDERTDTFSILMERGNRYRIEWITAAEPFISTYKYWSVGDGDFTYSMMERFPASVRKDADLGGNLSFFSAQCSTLPAAFYGFGWGNKLNDMGLPLDENTRLIRLPDEMAGDTSCYVLSRTNVSHGLTLWVGKEDFLIRRCRQFISREQGLRNLERAPNSPLKPEAVKDILNVETHENISINETHAMEEFVPAGIDKATVIP